MATNYKTIIQNAIDGFNQIQNKIAELPNSGILEVTEENYNSPSDMVDAINKLSIINKENSINNTSEIDSFIKGQVAYRGNTINNISITQTNNSVDVSVPVLSGYYEDFTINKKLTIESGSHSSGITILKQPSISIENINTGIETSLTETPYFITLNGTAENGTVKGQSNITKAGYLSVGTVDTNITNIVPTINDNNKKIYIQEALSSLTASLSTKPTVKISKSLYNITKSTTPTNYYIDILSSKTNGSVSSTKNISKEGYIKDSKETKSTVVDVDVSGSEKIYLKEGSVNVTGGALTISPNDSITPNISSSLNSNSTNISAILETTKPKSGYYIGIDTTTAAASKNVTANVSAIQYQTNEGYVSSSELNSAKNESSISSKITVESANKTVYGIIPTGSFSINNSVITPLVSIGSTGNVETGLLTTTKPASGYYVTVNTQSENKTINASVKTEGYIKNETSAGKVTLNPTISYIPITKGSTTVKSSVSSGELSGSWIPTSNIYRINQSTKQNSVTPSVTEGYIVSGTSGTITVNGASPFDIPKAKFRYVSTSENGNLIECSSAGYLPSGTISVDEGTIDYADVKAAINGSVILSTTSTVPSGAYNISISKLSSTNSGYISGSSSEGNLTLDKKYYINKGSHSADISITKNPSVSTSLSGTLGSILTTVKPSGTDGTDYWSISSIGTATAGTITANSNVNTAGYITSGTVSKSASINPSISTSALQYIKKASISISNGTAKPVISKNSSSNVSSGAPTTSKPASGYYLSVQTAATSGSATISASASGLVKAGELGSAVVNVDPSAVTYIPITTGSISYTGGELSQSSLSANVTGTNADFSDSNTSGISIVGSGSGVVTMSSITDTRSAGYIASRSSTAVINSKSSTINQSTTKYLKSVTVSTGKNFSVKNSGTLNISNSGNVNYDNKWNIKYLSDGSLEFKII